MKGSATVADMTIRNALLITHADGPSVFLQQVGENIWALPSTHMDDAPAIIVDVRTRFGIETTVLGILADDSDYSHDQMRRVYALECHSPQDAAPSYERWGTGDVVGRVTLRERSHRELTVRWLEDVATGAMPPRRASWMHLGWYAEAVAWIGAQLAALGMRLTSPIEQYSVLAWSHVLRVPTDHGLVYFKAAPPFLADEPWLTADLSRRWPNETVSVLALDSSRSWLLLADGGSALREHLLTERELAIWSDTLRQYARLQIAAIPAAGELIASGCPDRRLARVPSLFAALAAEEAALCPGTEDDVSPEQLAQLRAMMPDVTELCVRLAAYSIPETLHHDDLHPGNVLERDGARVFFDWAESAVTHPFCSLMVALRWPRYRLDASEEELAALRDAYLSEWRAYGSVEELRAAAALAERMGALHRALSWNAFLAKTESAPAARYRDNVPGWLKIFAYGEK
jgi:hypothetical protein